MANDCRFETLPRGARAVRAPRCWSTRTTPGSSPTPIRFGIIFKTPDDDGFIDALAVTVANDLNAVHPDKQSERVELFEKYALIGLREMKRACYDERPDTQ